VPVTSGDAPRRCAVVINPIRVDGVAERRRVIETILADAGWPAPGWFETTAQDPGAGQVRRAIAGGAEVVFVCGGDGTVRSSVEGIAGSDAALAVLPAGTGNLLALNFGLPKDTAEGVRMAVAGGRRRVDVGDVDGQVFAVMAGMGLDAAVKHRQECDRPLTDPPVQVQVRASLWVPHCRRGGAHAWCGEPQVGAVVAA